MFTLLFGILFIVVFIEGIIWAVKISWGVMKVLAGIIIYPLVFIGLCLGGMVSVAFIVLAVMGLISTVGLFIA